MSYIDAHGNYHADDAKLPEVTPTKTSVWKHADHDRQRRDHAKELIRPWLPDGTLNPEFIAQYPEEAKESYGFNPDANLELTKE